MWETLSQINPDYLAVLFGLIVGAIYYFIFKIKVIRKGDIEIIFKSGRNDTNIAKVNQNQAEGNDNSEGNNNER